MLNYMYYEYVEVHDTGTKTRSVLTVKNESMNLKTEMQTRREREESYIQIEQSTNEN